MFDDLEADSRARFDGAVALAGNSCEVEEHLLVGVGA
jgi:hypothetical protein